MAYNYDVSKLKIILCRLVQLFKPQYDCSEGEGIVLDNLDGVNKFLGVVLSEREEELTLH